VGSQPLYLGERDVLLEGLWYCIARGDSERLFNNRVELAVPHSQANWLRQATGAHWEPGPGGVTLRAWDLDSRDPAHDRRRLEAHARRAISCLERWPGAPEPPEPCPSRVRLIPAALITSDDLPMLEQGFELQILDDQATMADLDEALSSFGETQPWTRTRAQVGISACEGCRTCCGEPVPVSPIDMARLRASHRTPNLGLDGDLAGCIVPLADGWCSFLDRASARCTVWQDRPWVCRSYFCCPEGPVMDAVREELNGHILATTLDLGVDTPLRHATDYRQVLLIDLLGGPVWLRASGKTT
jgi:hypothetical protein